MVLPSFAVNFAQADQILTYDTKAKSCQVKLQTHFASLQHFHQLHVFKILSSPLLVNRLNLRPLLLSKLSQMIPPAKEFTPPRVNETSFVLLVPCNVRDVKQVNLVPTQEQLEQSPGKVNITKNPSPQLAVF